jgi:hypothetical protein
VQLEICRLPDFWPYFGFWLRLGLRFRLRFRLWFGLRFRFWVGFWHGHRPI